MKKTLCLLLCIIIFITLTGCWSRKEPKDLAIIESVIYDKHDEIYSTTIEILNPSAQGSPQESGSGKSAFITARGVGKSMPEALRNVSESLEKAIFGGHNNARFFSEEFAKDDISTLFDYFLRDYRTDETPLMIIIKDEEPERIYSCMLGLSETVGEYIDSLSKSQSNTTSRSVSVSTLDFIKDYYAEGKQPVAGVAELVEGESTPSKNSETDSEESSEKKYRIKCDGLAAFKNGTLVGYMDGIQARAYNFVTNNVESAIISVESKEGLAAVTINRSKCGMKVDIKDEQATIDVNIKISMSLMQESGYLDVSKIEPLKIVENDFNKLMTDEITASIKKAQTEFKSDIFGFGKNVHSKNPKKWKEIKENWDDYFATASINVTVESSADRTGQIKKPFKMEE